MTAVTATPGSGGRRRRRVALVALAVAMIIVAVFLLVFTGMARPRPDRVRTTNALTCDNAQGRVKEIQSELQDTQSTDFTPGPKGQERYQAKVDELNDELGKAYGKVVECAKEGGPDGPTTTVPPGGDPTVPKGECNGVKYAPYEVAGTNRFGPEAVAVAGSGDVDKVKEAWLEELKVNPFHTAAMRQGRYLVDGGIGTAEVQGRAAYYQAHPDAWREANADLRARLGRASLELVKVSGSYATQEAVIGNDRCVAPAAKDVTSSGDRWLFRIHLAAQDGGRTIDLVVFCNFQIHEQGAPPPASPVPERPTPTPTSPPPVTVPPKSPPTTAPPTTQPPRTTTTTQPPTTTTLPPKLCGGPGQPSCTGTVSE